MYIYDDWFSSTMLKYSKKETDGEFYRRYLETCYGKELSKKFDMSSLIEKINNNLQYFNGNGGRETKCNA
jgi:hypothetical protein